MSSKLLTTKLHIPQIRIERVMRPHLVTCLQQGLDKKLILISAPAGYGKTTLICEWLLSCNQPTAWVSLDKGDNDPTRFWKYIIAALQNAFFSAGRALPDFITHPNLLNREALLTDLVNELDKLQQPLILILDDYHNIELQSIHGELSFLLENAPANFHLVIATRADPPLLLAKMRARSQLVELRLSDLRFSTQEIAKFLGTVMRLDLSPTDLSLLETTTEGWIAGLQMAGLSLQERKNTSAFIKSFSGENRYILDFLFEEVFHQQSQDIQNFLLQSSVLERFCAPLCNAVTQRENSQVILGTLEQNNLFLISLDDQRKWYRYHHLFGDLLRSHLKQSFTSVEKAVLHQRAIVWYEAENDLDNALAHALSAKNFERAADLIEQIAKTLDMQNQQAELSAWLDELPLEILYMRPWLCVYHAWSCYWTGRREEEEKWLQKAEKSIGINTDVDDSERQHILGHIASVRAHTALVAENIPSALEMGQKALRLLPERDEMRSEAAIALAGAYWALGDVSQTRQAFEMARSTAMSINYTSMAAGATGFIGLQQIKQGHLQGAKTIFLDGLHLATLPDGSETPMAGFLNARLGDVWREQNELDVASKYLIRGVEQCRHLGQPDILTDAYICLGRYLLAMGDLAGAYEALKKADIAARYKKVDPWVLCWLDDFRLRTWLADDKLEAATLWAQSSGLSPDEPLNYQHDLHHQNLARVLVAQGHLSVSGTAIDKATTLLARLQGAAENAGWVHEEIKILIMQAVNYKTQHKDEAAIISLARAASLAGPGGYVRVFVDEGRIMHGLLVTLEKSLRNEWREIQKQLGIRFQDEKLPALLHYIRGLVSAYNYISAIPTGTESVRYIEKPVEALSRRELEILTHLAQGFPDKKIAESLVIARETVHKHLKNIYGKLGVHSRTEAIARARELGLL